MCVEAKKISWLYWLNVSEVSLVEWLYWELLLIDRTLVNWEKIKLILTIKSYM